MPIYAYRCDNCGVEFERLQKFSDKPLTRCPECRGKVRRVPQAAGIIFRGSGWYVKDSKSSSSTSGTSKSKTDSKSTGHSDAKASESTATTPASSSDD